MKRYVGSETLKLVNPEGNIQCLQRARRDGGMKIVKEGGKKEYSVKGNENK